MPYILRVWKDKNGSEEDGIDIASYETKDEAFTMGQQIVNERIGQSARVDIADRDSGRKRGDIEIRSL